MAYRERDLLAGERITERGHVSIEAADPPAFVDDCLPIRIGLRRGEGAVAEIGRLDIAEPFRRAAGSIFTVARQARLAINLLPGSRLCADALRETDDKRGYDCRTNRREQGSIT
jgi:hypothetical protein